MTAAGEFSVAVNVFGYEVMNIKTQGAPIEPILAFPVVVRPSYLGIAKQAPHPNAAKLYIDFAMSAEGQQLWASFGAPVVRSGVKNKYAELVNNPQCSSGHSRHGEGLHADQQAFLFNHR